jgi:hypothetical protein
MADGEISSHSLSFNSALRYVQAGKSYYDAARPGIELGSKTFEIVQRVYVIMYQRTKQIEVLQDWTGQWKL